MLKFFELRIFLTVTSAILGTGLLLDAAGSGKFGDAAKKLAEKVTKGYGV